MSRFGSYIHRIPKVFLVLLCTITAVQANPPALSLADINGDKIPMTNYIGKGQWVVANVWSPNCSLCLTELPAIEAFNARNRSKGVIVLGITIDFPSFGYGRIEVIKAFLHKHPLDYDILLADLNSASQFIGNRLVGIPTTVIFDPEGNIHARWAGDIDADEIEQLMQRESDLLEEW